MRPFRLLAVATASVALMVPAAAGSWGNTGHRLVGVLAIQNLPDEVPAFLRGNTAAEDMGELAREPDRSKGSGKLHDSNRDPAHFIDLDDDGKVLGGPVFADLKPTRAEYEAALTAAGTDSWKAGYLQYAMIDGYQQLVKDFGYWRVAAAAEKQSKGARKVWYKRDRVRRERLIFSDLASFAHYVGDGSQPLHVTVHYNGWGDYPNPKGYTKDKIHGPFESEFVSGAVTPAMVQANMVAFRDCGCPIEKRVLGYLSTTGTFVEPLYQQWNDGAFRPGQSKGADFAASRIGAGASELRDLIVLAWRESETIKVGWPLVSVADVEAGRADPWEAMVGAD